MSGTALKWIALITMLIDHIGAIFFPDLLILRAVGRLSMPIFCFLIAEGLHKTSNPIRYLKRLGLFALLSELPFDLAFQQSFFYWPSQNVFLTFFITAGSLYFYENPQTILRFLRIGQQKGTANYQYAAESVRVFLLPAGAGLTIALAADYQIFGFLMILLLYFSYGKSKTLRLGLYAGLMSLFGSFTFFSALAGGNLTLSSLPWSLLWFIAALSVLILAFYNGRRGAGLKWLFYLFYPVHLAVLTGIYILLPLLSQ